MSFAAPLALLLGALTAPVVLLYVLKVRRRRVAVPYLRLWEELVVETRARSLFERLRRLLSLLLQLLILAAIVFAIAQPAFEVSSAAKESVVLLLDTSASMLANEADDSDADAVEPRFERMIERARELVDGRSYEDEMLIAAVSDRVDVLSPFSRNTLRLRAALDDARPSKRSFDVEKAYAFAREVSRDREAPRILFVSDGAAGRVESVLGTAEDAGLVAVGTATKNVGIVRFAARKNTSLGTDYVLAVLKNFGEEELEVRYELAIKEPEEPLKTVKVVDVTLAPDAQHQADWEFSFDAGATLRLQISSDRDRLAIDDEAWAVVRPTRLRKVVLVAPELALAEPFKIAFLSMAEVISADTFVTTTAAYPTLSGEDRRADVTIVVDALPSELPARGNLILMNTELPDFVPAELGAVDAEPVVWDWDREHLLNRYLNYRDLPIPPARVVLVDDGDVLVESYEGPLVTAFDVPDRRVVHVAFDMLAEYFPFRLAFPVLLRNAIAWFEVEEDVLIEASYAPGDVIQPLRKVTADRAHVRFVRAEEPVTRTLPVADGRFLFTETDEPGAYVVQVAGMPHPTSVNLFDAGESSVAPAQPDADSAIVEQGRGLFNRDLWVVLAVVALACWVLEWFTYHRRLTE